MTVVLAGIVEQEIKLSLDELLELGSVDRLNEYVDVIVGTVLEDLHYSPVRVEDGSIVLLVTGLKVESDDFLK